jgi:hypothetical protein
MLHALEAVGVAWAMINVALFVAMKREDAMALSRRTIDRFWRAVGVLRSLPTTCAADALIETRGDTEARAQETRRAEAPRKGMDFLAA